MYPLDYQKANPQDWRALYSSLGTLYGHHNFIFKLALRTRIFDKQFYENFTIL